MKLSPEQLERRERIRRGLTRRGFAHTAARWPELITAIEEILEDEKVANTQKSQ